MRSSDAATVVERGGPPLIGLLDKAVGLGHALLVLEALAAGLVALAAALAPRSRQESESHADQPAATANPSRTANTSERA